MTQLTTRTEYYRAMRVYDELRGKRDYKSWLFSLCLLPIATPMFLFGIHSLVFKTADLAHGLTITILGGLLFFMVLAIFTGRIRTVYDDDQ